MSNEPGILPEPIPFGKYYLLERISVGGMAEIYKAKAFGVEGFERLLAVKKILSSIAEDESFIEMFIDEAKIAGQLNHPNIAQIFDLGKVDDSYYIALEYISGKDVKTLFERARRVGEEVNIPQVCHIVMKVCEGLAHAHHKTDSQGRDLNIVHRDISPQNILLSYEGEVKIIDFGIAKAQGKTSQTQVGVLKGKFSYMSPEQVRGLHVDHRSDIFSLGIVLYEMLTLERLFLGESDFDTLEKIRKVEMSPPSLYNPNIPKELEDIVLKALAQNPDDRFQSAEALAEALERFMRHQDFYYKNTDLAEFMKNAFQEDLEFEQKKLEYYQSLDLNPPNEEGADGEEGEGAGLVWDEEEMETQIFDRSHREEPAAAESLGAQQSSGANEAVSGQNDIVYADGGGQAAAQGQQDVRQSGEMGAVEVVGPDNKVDTIGPEESVEPVSEDGDAPTVEYDRWSVEDQLEEIGADVDGEPPPAEERPNRRKEPTAPVDEAGSSRATQSGTSSTGGDDDSNRVLIIGGTAAMLMLGALALIFGTYGGWFGSTAEVKFETHPKTVEIFVDGEQIHDGETPFTYHAEPGPTEITINKKGYKPDERSPDLEAGRTYRLEANLEKAAGGSAEIFVKSTPPGANVRVDGEAVENPTPVTVDQLDAGEHTIVLQKEGFLEASRTVEIDRAASKELEVELQPESVALTVESDPGGADYTVYANESDEEIASGETSDTVEELGAKKTYRVTVEKSGFRDAEKTFEPGTEKEATLSFELEAEEEEEEREASEEPPVAVETSEESSGGGSPEPTSSPPSETAETTKASTSSTESSTEPAGTGDGTQESAEPKAKGKLMINSRPAARVYIDGRDTGQHTPLLNYKVTAGKHKISLTNEEFGLDKTYYVDVKPGETKKIINQSN